MNRYTIAAPEAKMVEANTAMAAHTGNEADSQTFANANWEDSEGNKYAVCSGLFASQPITIEGVLVATGNDARAAIEGFGLTPVSEGV